MGEKSDRADMTDPDGSCKVINNTCFGNNGIDINNQCKHKSDLFSVIF